MLAVDHVAKRFGGLEAISDVSLELAPGSVLGVIGPNGSGKTTLINLLTGAYRPTKGSIRVGGTDTTRMAAHRIAALGVARTFQNPRVFTTLTVLQNLFMCEHQGIGRVGLSRLREDAEEWLRLVGLEQLSQRVASELSGGQQKLVEFARAMVRRPSIVLMDEPFAGVHLVIKKVLHDRIKDLSSRGETAFLIVSHEIPDLLDLSDAFVCMADGAVLAAGNPQAVCADEAVIDAYLGAPVGGQG
ncbi:MAG TPA: ABC transporter ATP-binding protein [Streptosporangiaceae bacterium]|nr:ABC transporter ATP-binding protein [Streptosporangiaceae bacterium]